MYLELTLENLDRIIQALRQSRFSSSDLPLIRYLESIRKDLTAPQVKADDLRDTPLTHDDWYFRNRSRESIVDMFRVIRQLQLLNGFKGSEIIRAMAYVWREVENDFAAIYLFYMIRELERDERNRRSRRQ